MSKSKKKHQKHGLSTGAIIAIVIGAVIIVAMIISALSNNSYDSFEDNSYSNENPSLNYQVNDEPEDYCEEGYTLCGDSCYSCIEGYYLGNDCECYPTEQTLKDLEYEQASTTWKEHISILVSDGEKTEDILNTYCYDVQYSEFPNCYNYLQPRLEAYANHIVNAQNFLSSTGDIFSNRNSLSADLDEQAVYVTSASNWLGSTTKEYNNWVATQQYEQEISQQREQAIYDTISILSAFI